jgi:hypothetical protein
MIAEIERLRADLEQAEICIRARMECIDDQAAYIKELESSLDEAETLTKKNAELMNGYLGRIKVLEKNCIYDPGDGKIFVPDGHPEIERLRARVVALEDALVEERAGAIRCEFYDHCEIDLPDAMIRARQELQADGKIGPDAKPHCWQITEERIGLLEYCLETLLDAPDIEEIPGPGHSIEMLRAMLREAEQ